MLRNAEIVGSSLRVNDILEFTKQEIQTIKDKIYLTDLQEKILDLKLQGNLTEYGMAMELGVSQSTIYYQWKKVRKKILKVI